MIVPTAPTRLVSSTLREFTMISLRDQPLKSVYIAYQAFTTLFYRIPFWIFISVLPQLRPRPTWTISRSVYVRLLAHFLKISAFVGGLQKGPDHLDIAPGLHTDAEWVEPDATLVHGKLAAFAAKSKVEPIRIPGYWLRQPSSGPDIQPGEKVLLALHGGAYISLSAYPDDPTAAIARGMLEHTPSIKHAFSPEYRLSKPGAHPFPSALLDALAAYAHLVRKHGVSPADIIIEGDSAGGNLALALTRYLTEYRDELAPAGLAPPGALLLLSPWSDIGVSHDPSTAPGYLSRSDYLVFGGKNSRYKYAQTVFTGPHGLAEADTNVYISPASKLLAEPPSFMGWPRTFIVCGGAEALAPSIRKLRERMATDLGEGSESGKLVYYEAPDGIHDYIALTWVEPERTETLKVIASWVVSG